MKFRHQPLIQFHSDYYKYPTSISRGYIGRYISNIGLMPEEIERRNNWLEHVLKMSKSEFHEIINSEYNREYFIDLLIDMIDDYGLFVEKFFHESIREDIAKSFIKSHLSLEEYEKLIKEAYKFTSEPPLKESERISMILFRIRDHIYDHLLYTLILEKQIHEYADRFYKKYETYRKCIICKNEYRVIDLPDWVYFGSNGCDFCCFRCSMSFPNKKELHEIIPKFINSCGFIPNANCSLINYSFTSRLPKENMQQVFIEFVGMGGIEHVKKKYGSWFKSLAVTKALPDGTLATARGIKCLADDGHECLSLEERIIDNWLNINNIKHEREPFYPIHPEYNPHGKRRADWRVGSKYIEYFGLIGDKKYDKTVNEKILLAKTSKIDLIQIYPRDISNLDSKLSSCFY